MKNYAFIPARGGSKGLPNKNFLEVDGIPILQYSIAAAQASKVFDGIWVVSDVDQAEKIAGLADVGFIREPDDMAGDTISSTTPVIWAAEKTGVRSDDLVWNLQPTSPLRTPEDIRGAFAALIDTPEAQFVTSTTTIDPHYFHWALKADDWKRALWFPDFLVERHLLPPVFRPNGAIKAGYFDQLRKHGSVFAEGLVSWEMPDARAIHIRDAWDLELVKLYIALNQAEFEWAH